MNGNVPGRVPECPILRAAAILGVAFFVAENGEPPKDRSPSACMGPQCMLFVAGPVVNAAGGVGGRCGLVKS